MNTDETDADRLRALLESLELSQREAASLAGINQRTMRRYCSGDQPIPPWLHDRLRERAANFRSG